MRLLQFADPKSGPCLGRIEAGNVVDITSAHPRIQSLYDLCYLAQGRDIGLAEAVHRLEAMAKPVRRFPVEPLWANRNPSQPLLASPLGLPDTRAASLRIWLAGVTHLDSARLREIEARQATGQAVNVYDRKYQESVEGGRPELFTKHDARAVVGHGEPLIRPADSIRLVPEPELVSVYALTTAGRIRCLGFTAGNDLTDNGMEAMNPLNLPQAKNWSGGCGSLGPILVTADAFDSRDVEVSCEVWRSEACIARKEGRTGEDHLNLRDGANQMERILFARFPLLEGQIQALFWGTPLVFDAADLEDGLLSGDIVRIEMGEGIGCLQNPIQAQQLPEQRIVL